MARGGRFEPMLEASFFVVQPRGFVPPAQTCVHAYDSVLYPGILTGDGFLDGCVLGLDLLWWLTGGDSRRRWSNGHRWYNMGVLGKGRNGRQGQDLGSALGIDWALLVEVPFDVLVYDQGTGHSY